ncbi:MAG: YggS family pyridoxal phosphate-dependent enzyme [Glaciecola sp.]|jgi:PLP dependent protein|nr:YggS family pyridoxal phosphate-dependent enzyme [Glaciecola sp.]MDG1815823.1 YggS family pyridoxal phosphate-dependent enzyme [Glaciecola sp.]MDG2100089.1 YggS family pyridoxal phosphate-dependent enzyme [Glaciecola sp.]
MSNTIANHLENTLYQISVAAKLAQRDPATIQLLAVSKTKPVSDLVLAYQAGQRHFGENYVQEGVEKTLALAHLNDIIWHFIGPIQSNKSKFIAQHFAWCHSIDRLKIAQRLNNQRLPSQAPLQICIQINIDNEASKAGIAPEDLMSIAAEIEQMEHLTLRGIMAIPKASDDYATQLSSFGRLAALYEQLKTRYPQVDTLSMGMSGDLNAAIASGSTMVRVGTGIFGKRQ